MPTKVYYDSSGRIRSRITFSRGQSVGVPGSDLQVVTCEDDVSPRSHYVKFGKVRPRDRFALSVAAKKILSDGISEAVITNIPASTTVIWPDGQADEVMDGEVRFSVDFPGTYTLTFDAVEYLREEVTIEAVAAT